MVDSEAEDVTDSELAKLLSEEGRATLGVQIETLSKIDEKAGKLLRVNVLLLGILLSAFSFLTNQDVVREGGNIFNEWSSIGFVFLLISSALASITYTASNLRGGVSKSAISTLLDGEQTNTVKLEGLAEGYGKWIDATKPSVITNALRISATAIILVYSLTFFSIGIYDAIVREVRYWEILCAILILGVFTFYSGVFGHLKQWKKSTSPIERAKSRI